MTRQVTQHGKKVSHPMQLTIPEKIESQETNLSQKIVALLFRKVILAAEWRANQEDRAT